MANYFSRRQLLSGIGAFASSHLLNNTNAAASSNPDVIIIGAGIAGITAARSLKKSGIPFTVVEARNRIGGRAYTETSTFGIPYDHGCAWLHSADKNPLTKLIKSIGFDTLDEGKIQTWVYHDGEELGDKEYKRAETAIERLESRVDNHDVEDHGDKSARSILKPKNKWDDLAHLIMGEYEAGVGTNLLSAKDYQNQIGTGKELLVPNGMAAGIFKALGPVPVSLDTKVSKIKWSNKNVIVETNRGNLTANAVIITVPTEIIADGTIKFDPALPNWKMSAFHNCPMAVLDKIALQFKPSFNDLLEEANTTTAYINHEGVWQDHLLRPFGYPLDIAFTGGQQSHDLASEANPQQAAIDYALTALVDAFGSEIRPLFQKGHFTNWSADPLARGSYSYAKVGKHKSRQNIAKPIKNRLFFAGEACVPKWATQATAAYLSGQNAAKKAISAVK